jgi:hypothetical protein
MFAISVIDLGLATGDLVIQTLAAEIAKLSGGQEFFDLWETVYLVGGIATGLPMLGALLRGGAKLLVLASGKALAQLVPMLRYALLGVRNLPKFAKGGFEIFPMIVGGVGKMGTQMRTLAAQGAMLLKGVAEGEVVAKYYLLFRNAILESGTLEEMELAIERILREGKADLGRFLERLYVLKTGTGGTFDYLTQVTSTKIFGQEEPMSCAAACIRQIVIENEGFASEELARTWAETTRGGTYVTFIAPALRRLLPEKIILEFGINVKKGLEKEAVSFVMDKVQGSWITQIQNPLTIHPPHTVIVDKVSDGIVHLRDPWDPVKGFGAPYGVEATIEIEKFAYFWEYAGSAIIHVAK